MSHHPEFGPATALDDRQIEELLEDLRSRAADNTTDPRAIESAIAELESEAARRGLDLPFVAEVIPPALAFSRLEAALASGDVPAAAEALSSCNASGLWRAYRRVRGHDEPRVRILLLHRIAACVEWGLFGEERARQRWARLASATHFSLEEYEAYLVQCIDALFTVSIVDHGLPY
jgi:hypothetical protein